MTPRHDHDAEPRPDGAGQEPSAEPDVVRFGDVAADAGTPVGDPPMADRPDDEVDPGWPWSFLLLVAAGAIYLIFRFIELGLQLFD